VAREDETAPLPQRQPRRRAPESVRAGLAQSWRTQR
jgi:hypothetical protein